MRLLVALLLCSCGPRLTVTVSPTPDIADLVTHLVDELNRESKCVWVHVGPGGYGVRVNYEDNEAIYLLDTSTEPASMIMSRPSYRDAWDAHFYGKLGELLGYDIDSRWNNDPPSTIAFLLRKAEPCGPVHQ